MVSVSTKSVLDLITTPCDVAGLHRLSIGSVVGALWLQTHFPSADWDTLLAGKASFSSDCVDSLMADARSAGLNVQQLVVVES